MPCFAQNRVLPSEKARIYVSANTISSKGQVTVLRDVRERLGLQAGDKIAWSMLSNGTIVLRPKTRRLADLVGILTQPGQSGVSVDEMRLPE